MSGERRHRRPAPARPGPSAAATPAWVVGPDVVRLSPRRGSGRVEAGREEVAADVDRQEMVLADNDEDDEDEDDERNENLEVVGWS